MIYIYEALLKCKIEELDKLNPIYTLSGGMDSSLIFSYLNNPDCFCAQADGNSDYEYAKRLYPNVIKIEFNNVDIEKILIEVQSLSLDKFYYNWNDMYDYFVYTQFSDRLIIVGEEPRFDHTGKDITRDIRRLFFHFRHSKVDSPYMYNINIYDKEIIRELVRRRLPRFIYDRPKKDYIGPNPVWKNNHKDQIDYLMKKYNVNENDFIDMWANLNLAIWRKLNK